MIPTGAALGLGLLAGLFVAHGSGCVPRREGAPAASTSAMPRPSPGTLGSDAPSVGAVAAPPPSSSSEVAATSGTYRLDSPGADAPIVDVWWTKTDGSAHMADRVRVRGSSGGELFFETPADALQLGRPVAPLFEIEREITGDRVLLLGWSSLGGGTQRYHAVVVPKRAPRVTFELQWLDSRIGVGLAVSGGRIGVPRPSSLESELTIGARHWDRAALDALTYEPPPADAAFYAAPVAHDEARSRAAHFAWFDLTGSN
ncbi:MAG: hypothetical protein U0414_24720 [Polyangiaceae bacterium]